MKIALITDGIYPYVMGGMQKHSYFLAKYLAKNKIKIDLYHYIAITKKDLPSPFSEEELKYIDLIEIDYPKPKKFPGHYLYERYEYSKRVLEVFLSRSMPDFVYAKGFAAWAMLKFKKKHDINVPIGVNFHGYEMFQKWPNFKTGIHLQILKPPVLYHMRKADKLFSYGGKISDIIKSKGQSSKIIEIPTGIGSNWLRESKDLVVRDIIKFVFVGRSERRKGIEEINTVLYKIKDKFNFEFHFVGPIDESKQIQDSKITYHGPIFDADKLKDILDSMDVLVCPSYSEGMPNVIMEGMARGCAIIATDVGAVSEMLSGTNGWLLNTNSKIVSELEKSMIKAIMTDNMLTLKKESISKAKALTWDEVIKKCIKILKDERTLNSYLKK